MELAVIGAPTSAGAHAPGQEDGPAALRAAGLLDLLRERGHRVTDHGDVEPFRWRPDRDNRRAQNLPAVADRVAQVRSKVERAPAPTLVLGGDCTVELGVVAARPGLGLVYFDLHPDLNVPASVQTGALDHMGLAHMLAVDGCVPELAGSLAPHDVQLLATGPAETRPFERERIAELGLWCIEDDEVAADPAGAAARTRAEAERRYPDGFLIHFDTDTIDFTDLPLSENTGLNIGLSADAALEGLRVLLASPAFAGLTVTELNPHHGEPGQATVIDFARRLAAAFGAA
jgi:arginase